MKLDLTLDEVQNSRFFHIYYPIMREKKYPHLDEMEICVWLMAYHKFVIANGMKAKYMTRMQFQLFLELYCNIRDNRIVQRIIDVVSVYDIVFNHHFVGPKAWLALYNIFTTKSLDVQMEFCFNIYDLRGQKYISRHNMEILISNFVIEDDDDLDDLKLDLMDLLMTRFDHNKDGKISFQEYCVTVRQAPELLQFLGACLPERKDIETIFERSMLSTRLSILR